MRLLTAVLGGLLFAAGTTAVKAEVPKPIVALLGPSIGYLLSQSDLCQWGLTDKIRATYRNGFTAIGMTEAQQSAAWAQAAEAQRRMADLPADAKERMKADTCTAVARERVEHELGD